MAYTAAVITVSDKGARGERVDTSGPALCAMLKEQGYDVVHTAIIPDEREQIKAELIKCADYKDVALVLTTGGTGFSPRDITPEATLEVVERRTPGIPEAMRAESLRITPKGCLSRGEAGIRGRTLIVNLPGSEKAAKENLGAVLTALDHGLEMLQGSGSANCAEQPGKKTAPSMDQWLREAKADPSATKIGMYLTHNGVVRQTAKAKARGLDSNAADVSGMDFSYDREKLPAVIEETYKLEGIYYIRVWLNEGQLQVGDDIMYVLIGGDIRPHVVDALQYLVGRIKNECVIETELH
ncbi:MAG: MogA/MoaB family molybdenum cofactor biosynthesis protein [Oscillospiraceae bacterium]|nr:MogA/MoaB family molybdenum cofactor biosynthesis protein [Oscillospiraceae bacterium]